MPEVNDAVILAGGIGTRMLPASLYVPKETLPLIDIPLINHLIWEVSRAGINRVHLVLSERKYSALSEFLDSDSILAEEIRPDLPREVLRLKPDGFTIIPHIQENAGGVADAISTAITSIDGPFLVLLGDMLLLDRHVEPQDFKIDSASSASKNMVSEFERTGLPSVGVYPLEESELNKYGVVRMSEGMVTSIVEKPLPGEAPSKYVLCGRYILPENTAEILAKYPTSQFGELQSIQLLSHLINNGGLQAIKLGNMDMYDSGDPFSWLKAQVDHALRRRVMGRQMAEWIRERISEFGG